MMRFDDTDLHRRILLAIRRWCQKQGISALRADDKRYADDLWPNVRTYMHGCGFGIAVFERLTTNEFNPNVSLEVGYMHALGKPVCLLKDSTLTTLQSDFIGRLYDSFNVQKPNSVSPVLDRWIKDKASILSRTGIASNSVLSRYLAIRGLRWTDIGAPAARALFQIGNPLSFNLVDGEDIVYLGLFQGETAREVAFRLFHLLKNLSEARIRFETVNTLTMKPEEIAEGRRIWSITNVEVVVSPDIERTKVEAKIKELTGTLTVVPWKLLTEEEMSSAVNRQYDVLGDFDVPAPSERSGT